MSPPRRNASVHRTGSWLALMVVLTGGFDAAPSPPRRAPTLAERFIAQRALEEIHHQHRIWPPSNGAPKPTLDAVLAPAVIRALVVDDLKKSAALERFWNVRLTGADLQAEMDRMAARSRSPQILRELFAALGDDPGRVAECLARPLLADRLLRLRYSEDPDVQREDGFDSWWERVRESLPALVEAPSYDYRLPATPDENCVQDSWAETTSDTPEPRTQHTAVWTGSEMIVWGGVSPGLSRGARYNPATDTWTTMRDGPGSPTFRVQHTAVWTGTEMIIWGGYDIKNGDVNTGGRYNPATDTWTPTGLAPTFGVSGHGAVWTGSEMFVCGGIRWDLSAFYNPVSDSWRQTPNMNYCAASSVRRTVVFTGSQILVWNGTTGGRFDPVTGFSTPIRSDATAPSPRQQYSAVWTGQAMVVWGGRQNSPSIVVNTGGRYYPATDTWLPTETAGAPEARRAHTAVWSGQTMLVWGGSSESGLRQSGGRYDPVGNTWQPTRIDANTPGPRVEHTAVWDGQRMIVWGGATSTTGAFNSGGRYDPVADSWTPTRIDFAAPAPRSAHTAIWTGSEMIVWGGSASTNFNTGGRYDPATDNWTPTRLDTSTPSARSGHTAVWTGREMIVWGGVGASSGGRYDPTTDTWRPTRDDSTTPFSRAGHTAVWTGREMIVWGGDKSQDDGGRYDPQADVWRPMSPGGAAVPGLGFHTAVWSGQEMIIFGLDRGGRYDPFVDSWRALPINSNSPPRRVYHTAVWSGREMIVWGGRDDTPGGTLLNTGGRYNPSTDAWTRTRLDTAPPPRSRHSAVWTGREMIIWGGGTGESTNFNTGGRYDPVADTWVSIGTDSTMPENRTDFTAVWSGNQMLVWGGTWSSLYTGGGAINTGGGYCACPGPASFYFQDTDGDGHGDDSVWLQSCVAPAGSVPTGGDCNDANAGAWRIPSEARDLSFQSETKVAWSPPLDSDGSGALSYDLIRSGNPRDFVTNTVCVVSNAMPRTATDPTAPLAGGAFFYLVGPQGGCRDGLVPFGFDSAGRPISGRTCP